MGGTYDPLERNDDQDDDLKAGEEVRLVHNLMLKGEPSNTGIVCL
jgi:hypothetical protein